MTLPLNRRSLLARSGLAGLGVLATRSMASAQEVCTPENATAAQTKGPFYPVQDRADKDWDLTSVEGRTVAAQGEVILIQGQVSTLDCKPVSGALVEIWQACVSGRYNHPNDPNTAPLDENFQYWGRVTTDAQGRYFFKSIKPGAYPATPEWMRPPHIHVRVAATGLPPLITQMYFEGEVLNETDLILQNLSPAQRKGVVVAFAKENSREPAKGNFNIILGRTLNDLNSTPYLE